MLDSAFALGGLFVGRPKWGSASCEQDAMSLGLAMQSLTLRMASLSEASTSRSGLRSVARLRSPTLFSNVPATTSLECRDVIGAADHAAFEAKAAGRTGGPPRCFTQSSVRAPTTPTVPAVGWHFGRRGPGLWSHADGARASQSAGECFVLSSRGPAPWVQFVEEERWK